MHNAFLLIDIAPNRKKLELKIVTFCQIVPLIFKFVDLKSGQPNSNFYFENRHFLSHRPPNFLSLCTSNPANRTQISLLKIVTFVTSSP